MSNYQPIDYRLRCHTKRTDLSADVLRDIGEAYAYINDLQKRIQMLQDKNDSLLVTNEKLEVRIKNFQEGFEGSCTTCEPVGVMNQKLRDELDEARIQLANMEDDYFRIRTDNE